jgi:mercuric ion transport protein
MNDGALAKASVVSAVLASLCCIGPLVTVCLGLAAFGAASLFESLRPYLLLATAALLGGAFHLAYRKQPGETREGEACAIGPHQKRRKILLWTVTAVVTAIAAFPYYSGLFWSPPPRGASTALAATKESLSAEFHVEGMTCAGCAATLASALKKSTGVVAVVVSLEDMSARVGYDPSQVSAAQLLMVVKETGFTATLTKETLMGSQAKSVPTASRSAGLEALFTAVLQYRSDSPDSSIIPNEGREGAFIGSGDGVVTGKRLSGAVRWSLWSGNCVYPLLREGQTVPDGLHLCTMNPAGFIETNGGARIRFDGRGYGLRSSKKYRTSLTLVFSTEDARYAWLTNLLGVMEGEFDEQAGRATWNVYLPPGGAQEVKRDED